LTAAFPTRGKLKSSLPSADSARTPLRLPRHAEEVERGALEVLIRTNTPPDGNLRWVPQVSRLRPGRADPSSVASTTSGIPCHLRIGFRDPAVPPLWSTPNPDEICAVSGGYAYIIDTTSPERFTMIEYRPVLQLLPVPARTCSSSSAITPSSRGRRRPAWQSEKLSDEGVTLEDMDGPSFAASAGI